MNRLLRIFALALLAGLALSASAATYTILGPTGCGPAVPVVTCNFNVDQVTPLDEYAYVLMESDGIMFGNFKGPDNVYLGKAMYQENCCGYTFDQVCSNGLCAQQITVMYAYIEGSYVNGAPFTGLITLHFAYTARERGGVVMWERNLSKAPGAVTID